MWSSARWKISLISRSPALNMCFINKNRSKVDMKATDSDLADAYKEKQKRN